MVKRLRRLAEFTVALEIEEPEFIRPPLDSQRNAVLNKAIDEFCGDLYALNEQTKHFVTGEPVLFTEDRTHKELADDEIMEDWQLPLMNAMAEAVTATHGDILEIGFGLGKSSSMIQAIGVSSHTVIECNVSVIDRFKTWLENYPDRNISHVEGKWQDTIHQLGEFDGIFFHTYPLDQDEYIEYVANSATFAEHFFESAAGHLREGGVFTYFTNEVDSLSRAHQRALMKRFSSFRQSIVTLELGENVQDSWWADSIVLVEAFK